MKTHRSWHLSRESRPLATVIIILAMLAAWFPLASAQSGESGLDGASYTGPNYGWWVEWDESVWEVADENNSGGDDFVALVTVDDGQTPFGFVRLYGVEGLFDDPDECAAGWEVEIAARERISDIAATEEYDVPPAPPGGISVTYTYTYEDEDGQSFDNVEYMRCQFIDEDGPLLIVWLISNTDEFADVVPLFADLIDTIVIPEDGGENGGQTGQVNADSGIDGNRYTSPTYGFSVEWNEGLWTAAPDAELINDGAAGQDRLYIERTEDGDLYSGFYIEAKTAYDGDVAACVEAETDLFFSDHALLDLQPYEVVRGDPIAGESDAGGEYAVFVGSYEDENGESFELIWYLECQTLEEGESVAIFSLFADEAIFSDELALAQDVIASLER